MKVGMVSTFKCPCGVAQYLESLAYDLSKLCDLKIYAEEILSKENKPINPGIPLNYTRNWRRGTRYEKLSDDIISDLPDTVHFQYESTMFGERMFDQGNLLQLLDRLHQAGIKTVMTLHNVPQFNPTVLYKDWYKQVNSHLIVTNELMKKELLKWQPNIPCTVIPLGSTIFEPYGKQYSRDILKIPQDKYLIVQYGFFGVDKGMLPLIEAMPQILKSIPNAYLIFVGSIHPLAPQVHKDYVRQCLAKSVPLQKHINFTGKYHTEEETNLWLSATDVITVNHQPIFNMFSSSASGHRVLCAGKPILMNADDNRLSEFIDGVHCIKTRNETIGEKIISLHENQNLNIIENAKEYARQTCFSKIAERHMEVYKK